MIPHNPRHLVAESIESAIADLSVALVELDRIPSDQHSRVGWVAHAMNTYVSVNDATLDLIGRAMAAHPDHDVARWMDGLRRLGDLMHHAIGRLIRTSPPAEFALKPEYLDVSRLMQRACDHHRTSGLEKGLEIVCRPVGDVPLAWVDPVVLAVVADILLSHAISASAPFGEILVQVLSGPGGVVISVRDHGPGLTPLEQAQLFWRGTTDTASSADESKSFGLAIAKEFVDRMGGRLWTESESGEGTCISVRLPYHPDETPQTRSSERGSTP